MKHLDFWGFYEYNKIRNFVVKGVLVLEILQEVSNHTVSCKIHSYGVFTSFLHWHENFELCQPIEKACKFLVNGIVYDAQPGDIVIVNQQTVHNFIITEDNTPIRVFQFSPKVLLGFAASIKPVKVHIKHKEIKKIPGLEERLNFFFDVLQRELTERDALKSPFIQSLCAAIYFLLMRHFSCGDGCPSSQEHNREFLKIVEYINEHFQEDITILSLSKTMFLSRGKLSEIFIKYSGMTLSEYLNTLRMNRANQLISQGYSITNAALESGFQSIRNFNILYKKMFGITPSQYKNGNAASAKSNKKDVPA